MNREALEALREKVEAGEAPEYSIFKESYVKTEWQSLQIGARSDAWNAYNGSLDAAKALHEALLPGWEWLLRAPNDLDPFINHCNAGDYLANIWSDGSDPNEGDEHFSAWSVNPARAWLLAILSALLAEGGE